MTKSGSCEENGGCATLKYGAIDNEGFVHSQLSLDGLKVEQFTSIQEIPAKPGSSKKSLTLIQKLVVFALVFGNFCVGSGFSVMGPFFPEEAEHKGCTPSEYGFVFGVYQLIMFLMSPIYGKIMPPVTPKFLLVAGTTIFGVCTIAFGMLEWSPPGKTFLALAFVVRIIEATGGAAFFTAGYTTVAIQFPDNISFLFAISETAFGFGSAVGPAIGGALYQFGGFYLPFLVSGIAGLVSAVMFYFLLPNSQGKNDPEQKKGEMMKIFLNTSFIIDMFGTVTGFVLLCYLEATLEPHLRQFHLTSSVVGLIFVVCGGLYAIVTSLWGYICERLSNARYACIAGCLLCIASFLLVGPPPFMPFDTSLTMVIISQVFLGCGLGGCLVGSFTHAMKETIERGFPNDVSTSAVVSSATSSAIALGAFIGPSVGGIMMDTIGFKQGTVVMLAAQTLMMLILIAHMIYQARFEAKRKNAFNLPETQNQTVETRVEKF